MSDESVKNNQAIPEGFESWNAFWTTQGMPWRTEPEIGEERQAYLTERRAVRPDIEQGIYPFRDEHGGIRLTRADVEWLLATHESGGMRGPVDWDSLPQRARAGLDVRGADLGGQDLQDLPLARLCGGLMPWAEGGYKDEWLRASPRQRELAAAHFESARLAYARLEGATLASAHFEGADLESVHLEDARLREGHLAGANLNGAFFDANTYLYEAQLTDQRFGPVSLADVRWGGANIAWINWAVVTSLSAEHVARQRLTRDGKTRKSRERREREYRGAVRAYRQVASVLREQGLHEDADRFAYRAQALERLVLRRQRKFLRYSGSLFLDMVAGYGYRPGRSIVAYLLLVGGFAVAYYLLGALPSSPGAYHLQWYEALVVSLTAFHGRGFFAQQYSPGDPQSVLAAIEAVIGLLLEISFIATFTNRFFAR